MNTRLHWKEPYWQHIAALDLRLCEYVGDEWVLLTDLAQSLGCEAHRLHKAALSPANLGRVTVATIFSSHPRLLRQLAVTRGSLMHMAHRIRPGVNNRLLTFISVAQEISLLQKDDALARRAKFLAQRQQMLGQRAQAIAQAICRHGSGEPLAAIEHQWEQDTGLTKSTLHKALRGSLKTRSAQAAYQSLDVARGPTLVSTAPIGRKAQLTPDIIRAIRQCRDEAPEKLATRFGTHVRIVRAIFAGKYPSRSMQAVLAQEKLAPMP